MLVDHQGLANDRVAHYQPVGFGESAFKYLAPGYSASLAVEFIAPTSSLDQKMANLRIASGLNCPRSVIASSPSRVLSWMT
jgi:hypothetical protein